VPIIWWSKYTRGGGIVRGVLVTCHFYLSLKTRWHKVLWIIMEFPLGFISQCKGK